MFVRHRYSCGCERNDDSPEVNRLAGYEDLNDAERLSQDPTFGLIGSEKGWDRGAALTSRLQTFETEMLAEEENFAICLLAPSRSYPAGGCMRGGPAARNRSAQSP